MEHKVDIEITVSGATVTQSFTAVVDTAEEAETFGEDVANLQWGFLKGYGKFHDPE